MSEAAISALGVQHAREHELRLTTAHDAADEEKARGTLNYEPALAEGWQRRPARGHRWIVGVDLGQSTDPTAICALHHRKVPDEKWTPNDKAKYWKQRAVETFADWRDCLLERRIPHKFSTLRRCSGGRRLSAKNW